MENIIDTVEGDKDAKIQFRAIELLNSSISIPLIADTNNKAFTFDISTEIQLNEENKFIIVIIAIKILNEAKDVLFGTITTSNIFYIENYDEVVSTNGATESVIPGSLIITLNSISLSTTRGVMWCTFKGTMLHNALLPMLDPKQIATQKAK
jgi:hypothetical protein